MLQSCEVVLRSGRVGLLLTGTSSACTRFSWVSREPGKAGGQPEAGLECEAQGFRLPVCQLQPLPRCHALREGALHSDAKNPALQGNTMYYYRPKLNNTLFLTDVFSSCFPLENERAQLRGRHRRRWLRLLRVQPPHQLILSADLYLTPGSLPPSPCDLSQSICRYTISAYSTFLTGFPISVLISLMLLRTK